MKPLVELSDVSFTYHTLHGEILALQSVSFDIKPGEFTAIVGPSGCGKSTLLSIIAGLLKPDSGTIHFNHISCLDNKKTKIGYMFQKDYLLEWRTIYQNILLGPELNKNLTSEILENANHLLSDYGLEQFKDKRPSELSGGMRQRAALIRTLLMNPDLLLMDEPFSALDYQTRLEVSQDIIELIRAAGKTMLLITHDLAEAISIADNIIVLGNRPASVKTIITVPAELKAGSFMDMRTTPLFNDIFMHLWRDLKA